MNRASMMVGHLKRCKNIALRKGPKGRWLICYKATAARHALVRKLWDMGTAHAEIASLIGLHPDQVTRILFKRNGAAGTGEER